MHVSRKIVINRKLFPYYLLIITCTLKWLFEGVFGKTQLELLFLTIALTLLIVQNGFRVKRISVIWILYIVNLFFSVLLHSPTAGRIGRVMIMIEIACFIFFDNLKENEYAGIYRFLIKVSCFYALIEMLQFVFKSSFNNKYFPMLIDAYRYVANHYFNKGYYFGVMFNPHEIASLIAIAIVALMLKQVISRKKNIVGIILIVLLLVPLMLTQKKGVIILSLLSLFLVICILYASKRQWIKIIFVSLGACIGLYVLYTYILNHSDNVLFYRFVQFVNRLSTDQSVDSGRNELYAFAIQEFRENKLFGIGWKMFNSLTTSAYGYESGHEVNFDYLQWLCETGIVGFVLNIIPVSVMLFRTFFVCKNYVKKADNDQEKWGILVAVYSQIFTVIYAFIEIPFYDVVVFTLYVISCIVINGAYRRAKQRNHIGLSSNREMIT